MNKRKRRKRGWYRVSVDTNPTVTIAAPVGASEVCRHCRLWRSKGDKAFDDIGCMSFVVDSIELHPAHDWVDHK